VVRAQSFLEFTLGDRCVRTEGPAWPRALCPLQGRAGWPWLQESWGLLTGVGLQECRMGLSCRRPGLDPQPRAASLSLLHAIPKCDVCSLGRLRAWTSELGGHGAWSRMLGPAPSSRVSAASCYPQAPSAAHCHGNRETQAQAVENLFLISAWCGWEPRLSVLGGGAVAVQPDQHLGSLAWAGRPLCRSVSPGFLREEQLASCSLSVRPHSNSRPT
jgi:hypothetical protein